MRRFSRLVLATAAIAGGISLSPGAEAQSPAPLRVGVLKLTSSAPIFVGVEKGYFKEFGVEPELVQIDVAGTDGPYDQGVRAQRGTHVEGLAVFRAATCSSLCEGPRFDTRRSPLADTAT